MLPLFCSCCIRICHLYHQGILVLTGVPLSKVLYAHGEVDYLLCDLYKSVCHLRLNTPKERLSHHHPMIGVQKISLNLLFKVCQLHPESFATKERISIFSPSGLGLSEMNSIHQTSCLQGHKQIPLEDLVLRPFAQKTLVSEDFS